MLATLRYLGLQDYTPTWHAMRDFTATRGEDTPDEIWILQHPPVFTQGLNGKPEHLLDPGDIPVVQTDRGGQITYHGPGQLIVYPLLDLKRHGLGIRDLVTRLENCIVTLLARYHIEARGDVSARGVYVNDAKICSMGLRVKRGSTYHGLALNVDMDLSPFKRINPCGYAQLRMTQLAELGGPSDFTQVADDLVGVLQDVLKLKFIT